jgi:hypothetical protein
MPETATFFSASKVKKTLLISAFNDRYLRTIYFNLPAYRQSFGKALRKVQKYKSATQRRSIVADKLGYKERKV